MNPVVRINEIEWITCDRRGTPGRRPSVLGCRKTGDHSGVKPPKGRPYVTRLTNRFQCD